ncbi:hypothetical protein ACFTWH_09780 [Streptomyces sp. NPDC057011]
MRQFVAVPLGLGATVEGQVTGEETTGGVQLQAFPLGPEALAQRPPARAGRPGGGGGAYGLRPPPGASGAPCRNR